MPLTCLDDLFCVYLSMLGVLGLYFSIKGGFFNLLNWIDVYSSGVLILKVGLLYVY